MISEIEEEFKKLDPNISFIRLYGAQLKVSASTDSTEINKLLTEENYNGIFADKDSTCVIIGNKKYKVRGTRIKSVKSYINNADAIIFIYKEDWSVKREFYTTIKLRVQSDFLSKVHKILSKINQYADLVKGNIAIINDYIISKSKVIRTYELMTFDLQEYIKNLKNYANTGDIESFCKEYALCMSYIDYTRNKILKCKEILEK